MSREKAGLERGWVLCVPNTQATTGVSGNENSGVMSEGVLLCVGGSDSGTAEKPLLIFRANSVARGKDVRRGMYVSFSVGKAGAAKDVQEATIKQGIETLTEFKGIVEEVKVDGLVVAGEEVAGDKVVGCLLSGFKKGDEVEGFRRGEEVWGVARSRDLRLSKAPSKTRPKLNLSVKSSLKAMGADIMAQSKMAAGPDGTTGFKDGWTSRASDYVGQEIVEAKPPPPPQPSSEKKGKKGAEKKEATEGGDEEEEGDEDVKIDIKEVKELKINSRALERF